jgi:hypothetical protein
MTDRYFYLQGGERGMGKVGATHYPVIAAAIVASVTGYGITMATVAQLPGAIVDYQLVALGASAQALVTALVYVVAAKVRR